MAESSKPLEPKVLSEAERAAKIDELLLAEAKSRLDKQEARVDDMRTRALTLLSASGIVAGLFGIRISAGIDLRGARLGFAIAAIVLFALIAAMVASVQWSFKLDAGDRLEPWLGKARTEGQSAEMFALTLASSFQDAYERNGSAHDKIVSRLKGVLVLFSLEVLTWTVAALL